MAPLPLIFDLDDTLIASFEGYVALHQRLAAELGWRIPTRHEFVAYGPTWEATLASLWPDSDLQVFFARYEAIADDVIYPAIDGALNLLLTMHARGHRLFIVSKRSRTRILPRMIAAGIDPGLFTGVFALEDQPAGKPDPRCFEPVWQALGGVQPALYVGDRHEDLQAAQAAGVPFVAVCTGPEAALGVFAAYPRDTVTLTPVTVLPSVRELSPWLEVVLDSTGLAKSLER